MDSLSIVAYELDTGLIRAEMHSYTPANPEYSGQHVVTDYGLRGVVGERTVTHYVSQAHAVVAINELAETFELEKTVKEWQADASSGEAAPAHTG